MGDKKNTRKNYFQELAGLRMIKMFIEEYFHWGFQLIDQENDDGLDGLIIIRDKKGAETGTRIHCQIKCGPAYLKRETSDSLILQPYSPKSNLEKHLKNYAKMVEPTVLFYVNTGNIKSDGTTEFEKRNPPCWWLRLDNYVHDGTSQIKIPKINRFGEHSKGNLYQMVKPLLKNGNNYPLLDLNDIDRKLWYSINLADDAKEYYINIKRGEKIERYDNDNNHIEVLITAQAVFSVQEKYEKVLNLRNENIGSNLVLSARGIG